MRSVLIIGGSGFIGRHLTARLAAQGDLQITIADILPPPVQPEGVEFVWADVRQPMNLDISPPELVVNLAAVHRTPGHEEAAYFETNERGAHNVTAYCRTAEVRRIWFTSSISVYGPSEQTLTEDSPLEPNSAYGESKVRAEQVHRRWAEEAGDRRLVIVRPATIFGPGEGGNFSRLAKSLKGRRFFYPGRRTTRKACGYVGDLVSSLPFMETFAAPISTYNFAYASPPTIEEICSSFADVAGYSMPIATIPAATLRVAARVLGSIGVKDFHPDRVDKLVNSTNIVPERLLRSGYEYETDLKEALRAWYKVSPAGQFV